MVQYLTHAHTHEEQSWLKIIAITILAALQWRLFSCPPGQWFVLDIVWTLPCCRSGHSWSRTRNSLDTGLGKGRGGGGEELKSSKIFYSHIFNSHQYFRLYGTCEGVENGLIEQSTAVTLVTVDKSTQQLHTSRVKIMNAEIQIIVIVGYTETYSCGSLSKYRP